MNISKNDMTLYLVTDRQWLKKGEKLADAVETAVKNGVTCVQLREKSATYAEFLSLAEELKPVCKKYGVPFIINDNVEIAMKCGADGVHVGQKDMEAGNVRALVGDAMLIGVSAKTVEQALAAEKAGADYLGVGAVFATSTKPDASEVSHQVLREICETVSIPVVAIGGINKSNMMQLKGSGVDGVALVSAVFAAEDIEAECRTLHALSEKMIQ